MTTIQLANGPHHISVTQESDVIRVHATGAAPRTQVDQLAVNKAIWAIAEGFATDQRPIVFRVGQCATTEIHMVQGPAGRMPLVMLRKVEVKQ